MNRSRLVIAPALAAGLTALALPMLGQPAQAVAAADDFGYSSKLVATPLQVEVFEPTIPLPATPQGEVDFGYSRVVADSSSGRGRASYVWPGAAIGEGAKTIEEAVLEPAQVPAEIANAIYDAGYPIQVNATYPGGKAYEADESFPGMVQRAGAGPEKTFGANGFSSNCDTSGNDSDGGGDGGDGGDGGGDTPGLPDLPIFKGISTSLQGASGNSSTKASAEEPACPIPPDPGALMAFGSYSSLAKNEVAKDGTVKVTSRAAAGDVSLLGGIVNFSGVSSKIVASSKGKAPTASGKANYGTVTIAGQEFAVGPGGVEAGGQKQDIPGLPDEPNAALAELGLTVEVPKPKLTVEGKNFSGVIEGLVVTLDTKAATDGLRQLPLADIVAAIPDTGSEFDQIKKALQAAVFLSPKFVYHLGSAQADLLIADPIELPPLTELPPPGTPEPETPVTGGSAGGSVGGGDIGGGVGSTDIPVDTSSGTPVAAPTNTEVSPVSSPGLPPLNTIPGMLMVGALLGAVLAGSYVRKLGAAALGLGGACAEGLDSGLPDLRKA